MKESEMNFVFQQYSFYIITVKYFQYNDTLFVREKSHTPRPAYFFIKFVLLYCGCTFC